MRKRWQHYSGDGFTLSRHASPLKPSFVGHCACLRFARTRSVSTYKRDNPLPVKHLLRGRGATGALDIPFFRSLITKLISWYRVNHKYEILKTPRLKVLPLSSLSISNNVLIFNLERYMKSPLVHIQCLIFKKQNNKVKKAAAPSCREFQEISWYANILRIQIRHEILHKLVH